jgi:hypothetical protein
MQQTTDAVNFCSTVTGRCLFEWYVQTEDYCCFLGAYKLLIPREWRYEDVRIRKILAGDYSQFPREERKARILDDIWPQFWALVPQLADVLCAIPSFKKLDGPKRIETATRLETEVRQFEENVNTFLSLPHVVEALEPATHSTPFSSRHSECCPPPPFVPHFSQYPPSGMFRQCVFALKCYIRALLLPSIWGSKQPKEVDQEASLFSLEACRSFAGSEETLGPDPDALIPLFASLCLATTTCPPDLHQWLWYKLNHLEKLGHLNFDPVKRNLAKLWNMPEMVSESSPPPWRTKDEDLERKVQEVVLKDDDSDDSDDEISSDDGNEQITRGRGIWGLKDI